MRKGSKGLVRLSATSVISARCGVFQFFLFAPRKENPPDCLLCMFKQRDSRAGGIANDAVSPMPSHALRPGKNPSAKFYTTRNTAIDIFDVDVDQLYRRQAGVASARVADPGYRVSGFGI